MRGKLHTAAGVTAAALLIGTGTASAQGSYGDFRFDLGTQQPGAGATLRFDVAYRNPSDPNAKPPPVSGAVFRLPEGTRIDTNAVPQCAATDEQIRAQGSAACPAASKVGTGTLTAITGFGPPADPVQGDVHVFNGDRQLIEIVTVPDTDRAAGFDRLTIEGSTLTAHPPATPGGPPDGRTSVKDIHLVVDRAGYATAPPTCPPAGGGTAPRTSSRTARTRRSRTRCRAPGRGVSRGRRSRWRRHRAASAPAVARSYVSPSARRPRPAAAARRSASRASARSPTPAAGRASARRSTAPDAIPSTCRSAAAGRRAAS